MKLTLFTGIQELVTFAPAAQKDGRHLKESDLGVVHKGAFLCDSRGKFVWVGSAARIPKDLAKKIVKKVDLDAACVIPGFVECHTHLVFAGNRRDEFEMKNSGATYQEIAAAGGGILSTMRATRAASAAELSKVAQARVDEFVRQGVTTLEMKSGYALNEKDELKILKIHQKMRGPRVISTFLGAHAKPPEFKTHEEYLIFLGKLLPKIKKAGLASRVDVFVEKGFFEVAEARKFLSEAIRLGFLITIHADQLSLSGATELALSLGAQSADHAICIGDKEITALAKSKTVAVLLPTADLYMKCAYPPARKMLDAGVAVALATDFNPGTAPSQDLSLVGLLARLKMQMTLPETLAAMTYNAAKALGLEQEIGSIEVEKSADFVVLNDSWKGLFYSVGHHPIRATYCSGKLISKKLK